MELTYLKKREATAKGIGSGSHYSHQGGSGQAKGIQTETKKDGRKDNGKQSKPSLGETERAARDRRKALAKNRRNRETNFANQCINPQQYMKWFEDEGYELSPAEFNREKPKQEKAPQTKT